jgi:hypothetical protein
MRGAVESLRGEAFWEALRSLGVCPLRGFWDLPLCLSLLPPGHEVSSFLCHLLPTVVTQEAHLQPKAMGPPDLGLESLKL